MTTPSVERPFNPGPMIPSKAIPAEASLVLMARAPVSLFETTMRLDWLGPTDAAQLQALREEIDAFTTQQIGVTLTSARELSAFMLAPKQFGVIVSGIEGQLTGSEFARHADTPLYEFDDGVLVARSGELLLIGDALAVAAMLDTLAGTRAALVDRDDGIAQLIAHEGEGAIVLIAAQRAGLAPELEREVAQLGIDRALIRVGGDGLRAVADGSHEQLQALVDTIVELKAEALAGLERAKQQAVTGDSLLEGVAAITSSYTAKRLAALVEPKLDGDRLRLDIPLAFGDPAMTTMAVALAGVGAAAAIPALQKYQRRASSAEAKVQIAKLFDSVSAHFKEEHPTTDLLAVPHQCPNDGRAASGSAGVTPPLSVRCATGEEGQCVPGGTGLGGYAAEVWTDNPVWKAMNFQIEEPHRFHYDFRWKNLGDGYGACMFTVQAFADLDNDGIYSTYERSGAADIQGVNAAIGLYIDREVE